jgi:hypothetical protein
MKRNFPSVLRPAPHSETCVRRRSLGCYRHPVRPELRFYAAIPGAAVGGLWKGSRTKSDWPAITSSELLIETTRERDAQSSARRFTSRHVRYPAVSRANRTPTDCEYTQPFRHIQYNRTANWRSKATLAMLFSRRIARCQYLCRQSWLHRAAACAASTSKKRNSALPCLLMCPNRCRPPLDSSLGMSPR